MAEKITYDKAKAELEIILEELEGGEVGIDQLAKLVKRANELIKLCKDKLKATDEEVKTILESFED
ncbi:MAG: exodeoxyribonuclease VII small subunit [Bacteroidota bacterium]